MTKSGSSYTYMGGFAGYAENMNLTCSNSEIINDPVGFDYYADATYLGSVAGCYYYGDLTNVYFKNYDATITDFFGSTSMLPDMSTSTFVTTD